MPTDNVNLVGARSATILASGARTAPPNDQLVSGLNAGDSTGLVAVLDLTAFATAASLTLNVYGVDAPSGKRWLIASTGVLAAVGTYVLRIHPNNPTAAMSALSGGFAVQTQQGQIPDRVVFSVAHGNGNSQTYSLGAELTG